MLFDSPRTRALPFPGLRIAAVAFTLAAGSFWACPALPLPAPENIPPQAAIAAPINASTVQLADEITRRLRRMGINFTRTRLPHPYDPVGEVC